MRAWKLTLVMLSGFVCILFFGCKSSGVSAPDVVKPISQACAAITQEVSTAAKAEATCKTDKDCGIRAISFCNISEVGCQYHITNPSHSTDVLDEALRRYQAASCSMSKCDCAPPPSQFVCEKSRCVEKLCWEKYKPTCRPGRTCPEFIERKVRCR